MTDDKVKEAVERLKAALTDRMIHSTDDHCNLMTSARQADISWLLAERDNYAVLEAETVRLREIEGRLFERGFTTGAEAIAFIDSVLDRAEAAEAKLTALVEALGSAEYAFTHGTFNQRADNAREIIRQALAHHSAPVGEATPVKHTMTLNLTDEEMAALEKMAAEQALKPQTVFRQALRVYQLYSLPEGHPERIGRSPTYGADRLALPSQCPGCDLPADMVGGCGSPNCYWKANVAALPAAPTSAPVEDVGGLERDTTKLAATALTDAELIVEQTRVEKLWDGMFEPDENGEVFEGHGGSPGEWMHERMMEIAQEQQRRQARAIAP